MQIRHPTNERWFSLSRFFRTLALSLVLGPCLLVGATIPELLLVPPSRWLEESPPQISWNNPENRWVLEHSPDMRLWRHVDAAGYADEGGQNFSWKDESRASNAFYRLRRIGQPHLYVVGDSISTRTIWPRSLAQLSGRKVFTQAVGGTRSPSMVSRARGVELATTSDPILEDGQLMVKLRWHRYLGDRTHNPEYRTGWAAYSKAVS